MEGRVKFAKLNTNQNPELTAQHRVRYIPTLSIFKDGKAVGTLEGPKPKSFIVEWIKQKVANCA